MSGLQGPRADRRLRRSLPEPVLIDRLRHPFGPQTADARRQLVAYLGHREQAPVEGVSDPHQKSLKEHAHIRFSSSVRFHLFASASAIT
jgi:hypothetical protein